MRDLQIFTPAVEEYFNPGRVMLLPRLVRGSGWYGACFASAGEDQLCDRMCLLSVFLYSRPGEIWIRAVSYKERLIP